MTIKYPAVWPDIFYKVKFLSAQLYSVLYISSSFSFEKSMDNSDAVNTRHNRQIKKKPIKIIYGCKL
jgi:hypothetical protein